ncbi:unnamed protein product [Paramecium octaurelia]|uniref:Uncharacterized protein n=1 Tax=Paramecium octaurelia TaxID=43137 RepID=A0A8S1VYK7_PAROT|nr:unnamed protein product [Paramecium octaurelia]
MNEKEDTIYQSFINSEGSLQIENQFEQCQQCVELQKYVYQLEQEITDLNKLIEIVKELKTSKHTNTQKTLVLQIVKCQCETFQSSSIKQESS